MVRQFGGRTLRGLHRASTKQDGLRYDSFWSAMPDTHDILQGPLSSPEALSRRLMDAEASVPVRMPSVPVATDTAQLSSSDRLLQELRNADRRTLQDRLATLPRALVDYV